MYVVLECPVLSLLYRRRQRSAQREAEADRLIDFMGFQAYATAGRLAREANDFWAMRYWVKVQAAIARKTDLRFAVREMSETMIYERPRDSGHDLGSEIARPFAPLVMDNREAVQVQNIVANAEHVSRRLPDERKLTMPSTSRPPDKRALTAAR
jgi:hypothetical protein